MSHEEAFGKTNPGKQLILDNMYEETSGEPLSAMP